MKQAKKLLCMLLVMLLVFSTVSVGANAAYSAYKDKPYTYDSHENPVLSTEQRSSQVMDYLDEMLAEMNFNEDYVVIKLNLTSVDATLDTVVKVVELKDRLSGILGDLADLNGNAIVNSGVRRGTANKYDLHILYDLIRFLSDNTGLVVKFLNRDLDMGLLSSFVDADMDVHQMLLDMLYESMIDSSVATCPSGWTADSILQNVVDTYLVTGGVDADKDPVEALLPSMAGKTNINTQSIWAIIENAANAATRDLLPALIDEQLKPNLAQWEAEFDCSIWDNLNIDNLNIANYTWGQYDPTNGIIAELNHFIYWVLDAVWTGETFWVDGGNDKLEQNVASLLKVLYKEVGTVLLPASAEFLPVSEVEAMDLQELCGYIGKQYLASEMPNILWEDANGDPLPCTSVEELACYVIYSFAADVCSTSYMDNVDYGEAEYNKDYALIMLSDIAGYYLEASLGVTTYVGAGPESLIKSLVDWALQNSNFGGFFKGCGYSDSDNVWTKLDKVVLKVLPIDQIFGGNVAGMKDLIMNRLIDNIFNLNIDGILELLYKTNTSVLNKTIPEFVIWLVNNVLNVVVTRNTNPACIPTSLTTVDAIITNSNLGTLATNLLKGLGQAATVQYFYDSLLPILVPLMIDESEYVYNKISTPAGYSVTTYEALQTKIAEYDALTTEPDDIYDYDISKWNEGVDFELWRFDKFEDALDDAKGVISGYDSAVQRVADAQAALTAANATGDQTQIDAANAEVTAANENLASYNAAKYANAAYLVDYYYEKVMNAQLAPTSAHLDYVYFTAQAKGYKKSDYKNMPDAWDRYKKAYDAAEDLYNTGAYDESTDTVLVRRSTINALRTELIEAMRVLDVDPADLTALIALIAKVKDTDLSTYSEETVKVFQDALAAAQDLASQVLSIDQQDDVNSMVDRLQAAFEGLAEAALAPILSVLNGAKLDTTKNLIAGLELLLSPSALLKYVTSDENGKIKVETVNGAAIVGTGTKIKLLDNSNKEIAVYEAVIYGDANGDGLVDVMDTICLDLQQAYVAGYTYGANSAQFAALNLNGDSSLDAADVIALDSYANFEAEINQQNPFAG